MTPEIRITLAALVLTGCVPSPDAYSIPPQHKPVGGTEPIVSYGEYVTVTQPDAESYFQSRRKRLKETSGDTKPAIRRIELPRGRRDAHTTLKSLG
jgi:hypothetical protein